MNSVAGKQSLKRILASPGVGKYSMVSKFLSVADKAVPAASSNTAAIHSAPVSPAVATTVPVPTDLDLLDSLVEQTLQSRPLADQVSATSARARETLPGRSSDQLASAESTVEDVVETSTAAQEVSTNSEIQELSKELQEVSKETKEQREQAMIAEKQRAINDLAAASAVPVAIDDKPVVVLPITAASKEEAKFKTTAYSVKWLWEWCQKIAKMFAGAVVYKEEVEEA